MIKKVKPYNTHESKKLQISKMFDKISIKYDITNKLISFGLDTIWRRKLVEIISLIKPKKTLDIATGTADVAIELTKIENNKVFGIDISKNMIELGEKKIIRLKLDDKIKLINQDVEKMKFSSNSFDAVTIAFGVRNFENINKALKEIFRVLKSNGTLVILETSIPENLILKNIYKLYLRIIMPIIGLITSSDINAYKYLALSTMNFPNKTVFNNILLKNGFIKVNVKKHSFGIVSIYSASKP